MTTQEFIFNVPLYQKVKGDDVDVILNELSLGSHARFDGYNAQQGVESTYNVAASLECRSNMYFRTIHHTFFSNKEPWFVSLQCGRYGDNIDIVIFCDDNDHSIMKIGQYPTIADIHIAQIKQYNKVLPKEDLKEFTRAIGLAANGVGIGSYVYMRRIFEKLIYSAAKKAIGDGVIGEEEFRKLRMNEKIDALKAYLPATLVELKDMYGIISKGIHELSENECLAYFDVMRNGIELILDDILDETRKEEKRKATIASVAKIKGKIVSAE